MVIGECGDFPVECNMVVTKGKEITMLLFPYLIGGGYIADIYLLKLKDFSSIPNNSIFIWKH